MKRITLASTIVVGLAGMLLAAEPPALVNYQGVLRDASNAPISGSRNMVFRFFATPAGGSDLLADAHSGVSTVTLNGGLFSVQLGSGVVTPGPACLDCTTLARVFRKISPVYMEIQVQTEI